MKLINILSLVTATVVLSSCVHRHTVKDKLDNEYPQGSVVNIAFPEVKEGDIVSLYTESCTSISRSKGPAVSKGCKKHMMGEATVMKILNKDQAVIVPNDGVKIDINMLIERH